MTIFERLLRKWTQRQPDADELFNAYKATFQSMQGQIVLQHLIDQIYSSVSYSKDPIEIAAHNARRSVVQEILDNVYLAAIPQQKEQ